MLDKETVIYGLRCIAQQPQNGVCAGCKYWRPFTDDPEFGWCDEVVIAEDALTLLETNDPCKDCQEWVCDGCKYAKGR